MTDVFEHQHGIHAALLCQLRLRVLEVLKAAIEHGRWPVLPSADKHLTFACPSKNQTSQPGNPKANATVKPGSGIGCHKRGEEGTRKRNNIDSSPTSLAFSPVPSPESQVPSPILLIRPSGTHSKEELGRAAVHRLLQLVDLVGEGQQGLDPLLSGAPSRGWDLSHRISF